MNIYSTKILFRYDIEDSNEVFYEESLRLFHAHSFDEAFEKAQKMATSEEYEYINIYGKNIRYVFYKNIEAFQVFDYIKFEDGVEIFSTHFKMKSPDDDPFEMHYKSCSVEEMYYIRQAEFNSL